VPLSAGIRKLFEGIPKTRAKRILAGRTVRVVPAGDALYIVGRSIEEMILVEPRIRPGGKLYLAYALRDGDALADRLDHPGCSRREPTHGYRRAKPRRLGRAGSLA
jgi:hypothetical protein